MARGEDLEPGCGLDGSRARDPTRLLKGQPSPMPTPGASRSKRPTFSSPTFPGLGEGGTWTGGGCQGSGTGLLWQLGSVQGQGIVQKLVLLHRLDHAPPVGTSTQTLSPGDNPDFPRQPVCFLLLAAPQTFSPRAPPAPHISCWGRTGPGSSGWARNIPGCQDFLFPTILKVKIIPPHMCIVGSCVPKPRSLGSAQSLGHLCRRGHYFSPEPGPRKYSISSGPLSASPVTFCAPPAAA